MQNSILTNINSIFIQNNLNTSQNTISLSLRRISTGLKINQAKDDAAGSVLLNKTKTQLSGTEIVNNNTMHGISMLNVADSSLENMIDKAAKIRDLTIQALNSTYSKKELSIIQNEIDELTEEIKREKDSAIFNQKKIFDPSFEKITETKPPEKPYLYEVEYLKSTGTQWIDTGIDISNLDYTIKAKASGYFSFGYVHQNVPNGTWLTGLWNEGRDDVRFFYKDYNTVVSKPLDEDSTYTFDLENGKFYYDENSVSSVNPSIGEDSISGITMPIFLRYDFEKGIVEPIPNTANCSSFQVYKDEQLIQDLIPVIDKNNIACMYDKVTGQFFYNQGSGDFDIGNIIPPEESQFETSIYDNSTTLQIGAGTEDGNAINIDLGFNLDNFNIDITTTTGSKVSIQKCDELINTLLSRRSKAGSAINRLESIIDLQNNEIINLNSKKSLIADTDMANTSSEIAKAQIIQQVSNSLFSQSHQLSKNLALQLIGGI